MKKRWKILGLVITGLAISIGVIAALVLVQGPIPFEHPLQRASIAHAQTTGPEAGAEAVSSSCSECHSAPVVKGCDSCHTNLPTAINNTKFPHHDPRENDPPCGECHGSSNDARFVKMPKPDHNFCQDCHDVTHDAQA